MSNPFFTADQIVSAFWDKVEIVREDECWLWTGAQIIGIRKGTVYGKFQENGAVFQPGQIYAHRFSKQLDLGRIIPPEVKVLHSCDNGLCVNPIHLFTGSSKDNSLDMVRKGRSARGVWNGASKLSEMSVIEMRALFRLGIFNKRELGESYNVSDTLAGLIVRGIYWRHLLPQ